MPEILQTYDPIKIATPLFIALILVGIFLISQGRAKGQYESRDFLASMVMGLGSTIINGATAFVGVAFLAGVYELRLFDMGWSIGAFVLCFILDDLRFYFTHRLQHRSRWFWANHVIHHSSQHYNLSTALRQAWTSFMLVFFIFLAPLAFLGFHPAMIAFCAALNLVYQFFIHTETVGKFPPIIEAVMSTPSHHRVHHARNPRYLDANYAGVFIVWDRLFGTFVPEMELDSPQFGLVKNIGTFNPLRIAVHEWLGIVQDVCKQGLNWRQRFMYAFAPPGWSHDGSRDDSLRIKREYLQRNPEQIGTPGLSGQLTS